MNTQIKIIYYTMNTKGNMSLPAYLYDAIVEKLKRVKGREIIAVIDGDGNKKLFFSDLGKCLGAIPKVVALKKKIDKYISADSLLGENIPHKERQELLFRGLTAAFPILEEYPELKNIIDRDILTSKILNYIYTGGKK
jgi:hypothetical protein